MYVKAAEQVVFRSIKHINSIRSREKEIVWIDLTT